MVAKFKDDLIIGTKGEAALLKILKDNDIVCSLNKSLSRNKLSKWDIEFILNSCVYTAEVKYDFYESKSGNIAIEIFNPKLNKPSGLSVTEADLWVTVLADLQVWICKTNDLRQYISSNKFHKKIECGGDNNSTMLLYKSNKILPDVFKRIDCFNSEELVQCLRLMLD